MQSSLSTTTAGRGLARACVLASLLLPGVASAQNLEDSRPDAFVCLGESQSLSQGLPLEDIAAERDKRLRQLADRRVPQKWRAHFHCVTAELMKRLGDSRAADEYDLAIWESPTDPGYELLAGRYYQVYRGASSALPEVERRYLSNT